MQKPMLKGLIEALPEIIKTGTGEDKARITLLTSMGMVTGSVDYGLTEELCNNVTLPMIHDDIISLEDVIIELYGGSDIIKRKSIVLSADAVQGVVISRENESI